MHSTCPQLKCTCLQRSEEIIFQRMGIPTIDDFTFIKPISRGAFGKVFLGHKNGFPERIYAIKVVKKSDMINKNLTNQVVAERDAMAKLVSPFVVQLYYSIQSQENIFLVMEYMIGGDVKSLLGVAGYFDESMAIMYTAEVTLALQYLHRKGIVHRDLKPDNLLITAKGHIKLTDFGLAKLNMNFSDSAEIPMTPKTPMHNINMYDVYRTPGQILSLQSSFAFSSSKNSSLKSSVHSSASKIVVPQTPNSTISSKHPTPDRNSATLHSHSKLNKQKSMRDMLLSQSTSKYLNQSREMHTPGKQNLTPVKPPVKRLMSTLQKSSILAALTSCNEQSSDLIRNGSDLDGKLSILSSFDVNKTDHSREEISSILPSTISTIDMADDVFMSTGSSSVNYDVRACVCDNVKDNDCLECGSHQKAPSRQEKITDDTPQMHRTEESVWNSYAAKHLRSLRRDSYSEDSEDNEKENVPIASSFIESDIKKLNSPVLRFTYKVRPKCNPRRLTKTKSFCYPSDDESDGEERRYKERFRFAKKRNFDDVEQSPVRRTHSADSGLTREIALLRFGEPQTKRSHSIPRTRIRFHSGQDREKSHMEKPIQSPLVSKLDTKNCLETIVKETKTMPDLDKITVLSADEKRLVEGQSDTSASEPDHFSESDKSHSKDLVDSKLSDTVELKLNHQNVYRYQTEQQRKDSLDCNEPMVTGSSNIFQLVNKSLAHLQPRMVSSLNSDSLMENLGTNLSSICEKDGSSVASTGVLNQNNSVFVSPPAETDEPNKERKSSSEEKQASSVPILPPPPPKTRRPSGKKTPAKIRFASMATCISPYLYNETRSRNNSGWNDVFMTPDSTRRKEGYHTPKPSCPTTPKTPLQRALARSYSFSNVGNVMKTPFRTPKSVKRAPAPQEPEEERILGTPDYLAPEILLQKPHGPAVDWWSLGVCLFEFLTGVPPFNDQTPEKVFENILNHDIPWPEDEEALSPSSKEAIEALLTMDPDDRARARDVKKMAAFEHIDWENLSSMEAPWIPQPDDMTDTSYFEARNMMQDLFVSDVDFR